MSVPLSLYQPYMNNGRGGLNSILSILVSTSKIGQPFLHWYYSVIAILSQSAPINAFDLPPFADGLGNLTLTLSSSKFGAEVGFILTRAP